MMKLDKSQLDKSSFSCGLSRKRPEVYFSRVIGLLQFDGESFITSSVLFVEFKTNLSIEDKKLLVLL